MGSDMDIDEVRMMSGGFTRVEVRLQGYTRTIMIPMDQDLSLNTVNVVHSLDPFCSDVEGRTLEELDDATLSRRIGSLALRANFSTFLSNSMLCTLLLLVIFAWFYF